MSLIYVHRMVSGRTFQAIVVAPNANRFAACTTSASPPQAITAVMDNVALLSRIQFAFTIAFHYIYPPLSIGLGVCLVVMEGLYLQTKN